MKLKKREIFTYLLMAKDEGEDVEGITLEQIERDLEGKERLREYAAYYETVLRDTPSYIQKNPDEYLQAVKLYEQGGSDADQVGL